MVMRVGLEERVSKRPPPPPLLLLLLLLLGFVASVAVAFRDRLLMVVVGWL